MSCVTDSFASLIRNDAEICTRSKVWHRQRLMEATLNSVAESLEYCVTQFNFSWKRRRWWLTDTCSTPGAFCSCCFFCKFTYHFCATEKRLAFFFLKIMLLAFLLYLTLRVERDRKSRGQSKGPGSDLRSGKGLRNGPSHTLDHLPLCVTGAFLNITHDALSDASYSWNILTNITFTALFFRWRAVDGFAFSSVTHVSLLPASVWYFDDSLWTGQHRSGSRDGVFLPV